MSRICGLLVACFALLASWSAQALAQLPPLPDELPPPPSLPVPQLPLLPPPPPPPPPAPVQAPSVSEVGGTVGSVVQSVGGSVAQTVGGLTGSGGGASGSSSSSGSGSGSSSGSDSGSGSGGSSPGSASPSAGGQAGGAAAAPRRDRGIRLAQTRFIKNRGKAAERNGTVIVFSLAGPSLVTFRIRQEAPNCTTVGSFRVRGHAGRNRVLFGGRLRGEALPPGTYSITATAVRHGRAIRLGRVRVVILSPDREVAHVGPASAVCGADDGVLAADSDGGVLGRSDGPTAGRTSEAVAREADVPAKTSASSDPVSRSAGAAPKRTARDSRILLGFPNPFADAPRWVQSLLLIALGAAIAFLLVAALPAAFLEPRNTARFILHRRAELAFTGATILTVVTIVALAL